MIPIPSHRASPGGRRRRQALMYLAAVLAMLAVVLLVLGACGSRSGPPQPEAATQAPAAGTASPTGEAPPAEPSTAGSGDVPTSGPGAPSTSLEPPASSTVDPSAAPPGSSASDATPSTLPASTGPIPRPRSTITVPSFTPRAKGPVLPDSSPTSIRIPAIGVSSPMLRLGLLPSGEVATPPLDEPESKAGWYEGSPAPGSQGPAIILGHVDSKAYGPGVFYDLGALKPGDTVEVGRVDNTVAVFKVDEVRSFPKASFPTGEIYGNLDHAGLRLITCGGTFDPQASSYVDNIIVFASLVSSHRA